jgi:hypothetical protein
MYKRSAMYLGIAVWIAVSAPARAENPPKTSVEVSVDQHNNQPPSASVTVERSTDTSRTTGTVRTDGHSTTVEAEHSHKSGNVEYGGGTTVRDGKVQDVHIGGKMSF